MSADVVDTAAVLGDDLAGRRADDVLLDALGGRDVDQPESLVDDELNALLLAWRREVDRPPMGELVDTDTAVVLAAGGQTRRARWARRLARIFPTRRSTR